MTRGSMNATRLTINPPTVRLILRFGNCNKPREGENMGRNDVNNLVRSKWNCESKAFVLIRQPDTHLCARSSVACQFAYGSASQNH